MPKILELDAVIVGAGFAGCYLLYRLRKEGFNVKVVEAGSAPGGVWHWNTYPGVRVDSQYPVYAFDIPEVYNTWIWSQQYPSGPELQDYFRHVDFTLNLSEDIIYKTRVTAARWNDSSCAWSVDCDNGARITAQFFLCCLGFSEKRYTPGWCGIDSFAGSVCHSSIWPAEGIDTCGKKVGIIGNGPSGIQLAQEIASNAAELRVFIRTPNMCLPMAQGPVTSEEADSDAQKLGTILGRDRYLNKGGFLYEGTGKKTFDLDPEAQEKEMEDCYRQGGFRIMFTFEDTLSDVEANRVMYDFWARKTRARIKDPVKQDMMAPLTPPHPLFAKRPSLEQNYYEQMDKDYVKLIDLNRTNISRITPRGILTANGELHELDILVIATGFYPITGGYTDIDITGINGENLQKKWENGVYTYLGLSVHNMPNFFFTNGPQSPSVLSNGPSLVQPQGDWIAEVMKNMRACRLKKINPQPQAVRDWKQTIIKLHSVSLRDKVDSWYTGANIPGMQREALFCAGGLPFYLDEIRDVADDAYRGFDLIK